MKQKPNVIFIYADDLGRGMLSCYGQKWFKTSNIDSLCDDGIIFTNAHGCHICAPARASLMCGVHDSHCGKWQFTKAGIYEEYAKGDLTLAEVYELIHNTGIEERSGKRFLPMVFNDAGYFTGQIGKLEWGFATTGDAIKQHGWQYHYGYYDHQMCHGYYPPFVFEDGERIDIEGNTNVHCGVNQYSNESFTKYGDDIEMGRKVYSQDLFDQKIHEFLLKHQHEPFFLLHASQLPHGNLAINDIHPSLKDNKILNTSEKLYASMVLRLDETVGKILEDVKKLGLEKNTIIIFGSDNGHCCYYNEQRTGRKMNTDLSGEKIDDWYSRYTSELVEDVFNGNDGMTGAKSSNFEGGTRVPLIVSWPAKINSQRCDRLVANYDFMATMADLLGTVQGEDKDGLSYFGLLNGDIASYQEHEYIVFASSHGPAIVTKDGWKLRSYITDEYKIGKFGASWVDVADTAFFELFDLNSDYREERDLSKEYPEKAQKLQSLLMRECDGNLIHGTTQAHFVFYGFDYRKGT